ncbi:hypothetical protein HGI79_05055 [Clostridium sp. DJ247]|nr:hypothetical protein [Clostridium sp. DJ247]
MKTNGLYLIKGSTTNAPESGWGHLFVQAAINATDSVGRILQYFKHDISNRVWYRQYTSSAWTAWVGLANLTDIPTTLPANGGHSDTASKLSTARTISLTGDVTGSASFDGSANAPITVTVTDDSHNHVISNVDGLQVALDSKAASSHTHTKAQITDMPTNLNQFTNGPGYITTSGAPVQSVNSKTGAVNLVASDVGALSTADYVRQPGYAVATGTANTYAVTLNPAPTAYVDGMALSVKINVASTGASTINVNGLGAKAIKDSLGNALTSTNNLKANVIYTFRYESTSGTFIVQGKGGGGNATASQILSGQTATVDSGQITGTMPNKGAVTITPSTTNQTIATGYHNGSGYVVGDADLISANIKAGSSIFGIAGKSSVVETADATATVGQILSGKTAYVNGVKLNGTMANYGSGTQWMSTYWADGAGNLHVSIPLGAYITQGAGPVGTEEVYGYDADFIASNIVSGKNIFGLVGTTPPSLISPGTTLWLNNSTQKTTYNTTPTKLKEVQFNNVAGIARIEYYGGAYTSQNAAWLQLYKNDVPYGPLRAVGTAGCGTFTEDIPISAGDRIAIYGYSSTTSYQAYVNYIYVRVASVPASVTTLL